MILWGFLEEKNKNQKLKHRCGRVEKPPFEINYYNTNDGRLALINAISKVGKIFAN